GNIRITQPGGPIYWSVEGGSGLLCRRTLMLVFACVACFAAAPRAYAQGLIEELKIGGLYHDVPDLWSGFRIEHEGVDVNLEALFRPSLPVLLGTIRPAIGGTISTRGDTSHAYIDARWQVELPAGFFLGLGVGGAIHDGHLTPDSPTDK